MSRQKPRRDLSGNQILAAEVFARRLGAKPRLDIPTTQWVPLTDGAEPPGFITDGAGNLIYTSYPL